MPRRTRSASFGTTGMMLINRSSLDEPEKLGDNNIRRLAHLFYNAIKKQLSLLEPPFNLPPR